MWRKIAALAAGAVAQIAGSGDLDGGELSPREDAAGPATALRACRATVSLRQATHRYSPRATATRNAAQSATATHNAAQGASPCPRTAAPGQRPARARLYHAWPAAVVCLARFHAAWPAAVVCSLAFVCFARFHATRPAAVVRSHAFMPLGQRPLCAPSLWASGPQSALPTLRPAASPRNTAPPRVRASGPHDRSVQRSQHRATMGLGQRPARPLRAVRDGGDTKAFATLRRQALGLAAPRDRRRS
eukprot:CAMPEP_0173417980 /NCGR_PEP_ID=MMETSP1357-20121228/221_1 /TAXON_ID=77926 /ORGANISM="Hemiselmis rufescens, Strain PCC563" /LENGTH=245 /DNA_ID=CAMNT_0014380379 /DNA_START=100 /DNA_END=834 /DNA_ORIENTATION=+